VVVVQPGAVVCARAVAKEAAVADARPRMSTTSVEHSGRLSVCNAVPSSTGCTVTDASSRNEVELLR